jgi:hypothetical protein
LGYECYFHKAPNVNNHPVGKEMPVIPVDRVVDKKRIIRKNGRPRMGRGTIGR